MPPKRVSLAPLADQSSPQQPAQCHLPFKVGEETYFNLYDAIIRTAKEEVSYFYDLSVLLLTHLFFHY